MMSMGEVAAWSLMERELNRWKTLCAAKDTLVKELMDLVVVQREDRALVMDTAEQLGSHLSKQIETLEDQLRRTSMITNETFDNFVEQLNQCFKDKDVNAHVCEGGGFALRIEERDIQFDENLAWIGQGTNLLYDKPEEGALVVDEVVKEVMDELREQVLKEQVKES